MGLRFVTADVFTATAFGGNPLAVIPDARGVSEVQMRAIARELSLSETVFVFPPTKPHSTRSLRIFTPQVELPFAGHPTIGAAFVLAQLGYIHSTEETLQIVFDEGIGPVKVTLRHTKDRPTFVQLESTRTAETFPLSHSNEQLAALLGVRATDIGCGAWKPQALSAGVPFTIVPVKNREVLRSIRFDLDTWQKLFAGSPAPHIYPVTWEDEVQRVVAVRMFAPAMGIVEDPATGAAATVLATYLSLYEPSSTAGVLNWTIHQGLEIGRPSVIQIESEYSYGTVRAVRVGGSAVIISEGHFIL